MDAPPPSDPQPADDTDAGGNSLPFAGWALAMAMVVVFNSLAIALWARTNGDRSSLAEGLLDFPGSAVFLAIVGATAILTLGTWWLRWATETGFRMALFAAFAGILGLGYGFYSDVRRTTEDRSILGNLRQIAAGTDQFFVENGGSRPFVEYDDVVGPDRYVKAVSPIVGEDYRALFPRRQQGRFVIQRPDGGTVQYDPNP